MQHAYRASSVQTGALRNEASHHTPGCRDCCGWLCDVLRTATFHSF